MNDMDMARYMGFRDVTPEIAARLVGALGSERRALFERMAQVETELKLWQDGVAPKPQGIFVCEPKPRVVRRRKAR